MSPAVRAAALLLLLAGLRLAAAEAVRDDLARLDPPWYDRTTDSWRRPTLPAPTRPTTSHSWAGAVVVGALVVLAAAVVIVLVASMLRSVRLPAIPADPGRPTPQRGAAIAALPIGDLPGADDPEAALVRALAAGDWAAAVVWLYALTLLRLDAAGAIRLASGKTNGMYRREAAAAPAAAEPLAAAVAAFERSYFGHQPVDEAAVRRLEAALRGLGAVGARS